MNEFKGTPGPWRVSESRTSGFCVVGEGSSGGAVVGCQDEYDHYGAVFKREDAVLIAAAPELLEALKDCVRGLEHIASQLFPDTLERAHAAITKATSISN